MSRRSVLLGLLLLIGGCGGSSHSGSATTSVPSTTPLSQTQTGTTAPQTTSSTTTGPTSTSSPTTTTGFTTTTTSTPASGGAGLSGSTTTHGSGGGSLRIRVPATFVIRGGGPLSPGSVSAPAFLAVEVTVVSRDGHAHQVVVDTPTPHRLSVPAGGHAGVLLPGQRAGRYPIMVDGQARGRLLIGGEPGP